MKWEYKILDLVTAKLLGAKGLGVKFDVEAATKQLNELGQAGWELVLTNMNTHGAFSFNAVMIFKRPLPDE
jgi:hypothetical protein